MPAGQQVLSPQLISVAVHELLHKLVPVRQVVPVGQQVPFASVQGSDPVGQLVCLATKEVDSMLLLVLIKPSLFNNRPPLLFLIVLSLFKLVGVAEVKMFKATTARMSIKMSFFIILEVFAVKLN